MVLELLILRFTDKYFGWDYLWNPEVCHPRQRARCPSYPICDRLVKDSTNARAYGYLHLEGTVSKLPEVWGWALCYWNVTLCSPWIYDISNSSKTTLMHLLALIGLGVLLPRLIQPHTITYKGYFSFNNKFHEASPNSSTPGSSSIIVGPKGWVENTSENMILFHFSSQGLINLGDINKPVGTNSAKYGRHFDSMVFLYPQKNVTYRSWSIMSRVLLFTLSSI